MDLFTNPFCRAAQVMYIYHYEMLYRLDRDERHNLLHIAKVAHTFDINEKDIYRVLRMYGLLWDEQTVFQISTYKCDNIDLHHPYNVNFFDRWSLFKKHNPRPNINLAPIDETELTILPKKDLFKQGKQHQLLKTICRADEIWDADKLKRLRMKYRYENVEIVAPFKEPKKRRYRWKEN